MFGEVQVFWNITPAVFPEFESLSGTVTMRDRQSEATITLKVRFTLLCIYVHRCVSCVFLPRVRPETTTSLRSGVTSCSH